MAVHRFHNSPGAYTFGDQGERLWGIGNLIKTATERRRREAQTAEDYPSYLERFPEGPPRNSPGGSGVGVKVGPGGVSVGTGGRYGQGYQSGPNFGGGYGGSTYGGGVSPLTTTGVGGGLPMPDDLPAADGGGGIFGGIGRFITKNPDVVASLAGTAADVYGAGKERKQREKECEIEQENERKRREMDRIRTILQAIGNFA